MLTDNLIGRKIYCKRNGLTFEVLTQDDITLTIQMDDITKVITHGTFNRWYTVVPEEGDKPVVKQGDHLPAGEAGVGYELRDKFVQLVKDQANQDLELIVDKVNRKDTLRYNGRNVFECSYSSKRFNVMCHPNSLTPDNVPRAYKIFPKEWGWVLRAKFVFTSFSQTALMRSIIIDGLFYRQREE